MSAHPHSHAHAVLPWVVLRTRLSLLSLRCVDCRSESATTAEGRFRVNVNANGKRLDVWLLVRCVSCDRTSKLTVHERAPVRCFDPAVRPERIIARGLGLSRNEVLRRVKCGIPLRRPTSTGFTFTVMAED